MKESSLSPRQNCSWFGLFHEKATTPEMIRHGMELIKKRKVDLNPTQIPVMTVSASLRSGKEDQWTFPEFLEENRFVVLLGGLHIEMALLIKKSLHQQWSIFILGRMDFSFVGAIPNLQVLVTSSEVSRGIFLFILANRERKMNLIISALIELVHLFFAFDHNNYARWIRLFSIFGDLAKKI